MRIFIQLLNPCFHFTSYNKFTIPADIEEILKKPIILNSLTKMTFTSNNPYFSSFSTKNITDKLTIIRDIYRFFQPGLISYTRFEEKLGHSSQWLKRKIRKETSQKPLLKIFSFKTSGTTKIKDLQKLSNKEIHITLQSDNTKDKSFQFIS